MSLDLDTLGLSATVTAEGISAPDYQTVLDTITGYFQQIYGSDSYIDPDSKDGQMVALVALAIHDANNTAITVYRSFSPSTALNDALTSNVKINGISRRAATNSTVDELLVGEPGTIITNGSVKDTNGIIWCQRLTRWRPLWVSLLKLMLNYVYDNLRALRCRLSRHLKLLTER